MPELARPVRDLVEQPEPRIAQVERVDGVRRDGEAPLEALDDLLAVVADDRGLALALPCGPTPSRSIR